MSWDGKTERRQMGQEDHDLLTRIDANLSNHIDNMNNHVTDDSEHFNKLDKDVAWIIKVMYGGVGVYVFIQFMHVIK